MVGPDRGDDELSFEDRELARQLTALDRVEEYTAAHGTSFDEVIDWPAVRFEAAWDSYVTRTRLEKLEEDHRAMVTALYANAGMDGDALQKSVDSMRDGYRRERQRIMGVYDEPTEGEAARKPEETFVSEKWW